MAQRGERNNEGKSAVENAGEIKMDEWKTKNERPGDMKAMIQIWYSGERKPDATVDGMKGLVCTFWARPCAIG